MVTTTAAKKPGATKRSGFPGRKPGAKAGVKRKPPKKYVFRPPPDFKSCFLDLKFKTGADGLMSSKIALERVAGRWDNDLPGNRANVFELDARTAAAFLSRFSGKLFSPNPNYEGEKGISARRRLLPNTVYRVILRVAVRKDPASKTEQKMLATRVYHLGRVVTKGEKSKFVWFNLKEKPELRKDPDVKRIRAAGKFCAGAFTNFLLPPKKVRRINQITEG